MNNKPKKQLSPFEQKLIDFFGKIFSRIKVVEKIFFIDHLRTMVHAGLSLVEALNILEKEVDNKKFKTIISQIKEDITKGQQLSEVLSKHPKIFPQIYVKMLESGEVSGKMEESLEQIVIQMKKSHELASTIRGAMIYPSVIILAMGGIGTMIALFVLPKLIELFKDFDAELPLATRVLISITNFISNPLNLIILILCIAFLITIFIVSLKKSIGFKHFIHSLNLKLPIFGHVSKQINLARFSLTLSSLLKSTIPIINAVDITADTCGNILYRDALHDTAERIKKGEPLSQVLSVYDQLFPPMVTEMIMVGEKTGEIDSLLNELSIFYNNEVTKTLKNFTTIIEPVIILTIGVAVAGMAVAIVMPMYTLVQNF